MERWMSVIKRWMSVINGYHQVAMEGDVDGTVNARPDALYLGSIPHPLSDSEKDLPK